MICWNRYLDLVDLSNQDFPDALEQIHFVGIWTKTNLSCEQACGYPNGYNDSKFDEWLMYNDDQLL